jgi:hypothetical protein
MTCKLCIWDPARHGPLPTDADHALATLERLSTTRDTWNLTLVPFVEQLKACYAADAALIAEAEDCNAFWEADLTVLARQCSTAVFYIAIAADASTRQMAYAVHAAAAMGLVVLDDDSGVCFLPDGSIYPADYKEVWEFDLQELKEGPLDPNAPDGRTFWERLGSALLDEMSRGNRSR